MKTFLTYFVLAAVTLLASCRKSDNPRIPDLIKVPLPLMTKDATANQIISAQDPATFTGRFSVDMFYKNGVTPKEIDVVVIKNGDVTKVIPVKNDITSFPATVDITGQQLADMFGEPVVLGDQFDFGANITTQNGQVFEAFPAQGEAYGAGVANQPGASPTVRYEVACTFTAADYAGDFEVVSDEWADYAPGTVLEVTVIDETHVSFFYATDNAKPIIVAVDPQNNSTSVAKQLYGDYPAYGITDISAESVPSADNFVSPCEGILSVRLHHTDASGADYGNSTIVLQKIQ